MTRLNAVRSLVTPVEIFADVGCDHGYIARYAHEIGCKTVIASDISEVSVEKAKRALRGCNGVITVCSDGFDRIEEKVDLAVISGMGGRKIMEILDRAKNLPTSLILGPQHDVSALREYLVDIGYAFDADFLVEENGKYYDIMRVRKGEQAKLTFTQLNYGVFYTQRNETLLKFALNKQKKMQGYAPTPLNKKRAEALQEILKWQL